MHLDFIDLRIGWNSGPRDATAQYKIEGRYAPAGSLYKPTVISVIGSTTRRPLFRHQRKSSVLRVGTNNPGPANASTPPSSACKSKLFSATACPKNPTC